jgi:hypothetical protein
MTLGDRSPPPELTGAEAAANGEAVQADLAAIDERVFHGSGGASLDDQLVALRAVALNILAAADG